MEFQRVVQRRRMVRDFHQREIPPEVVGRLVDNALRAPSAGHAQGWAFLVIDSPEQRALFWDRVVPTETRLRPAPLVIVPLTHKTAYLASKPLDEAQWPTPYWYVDAGFATMSLILTAADAGLGVLFFAVFRIEELRQAFNVPLEFHPIGALAIGYPLDEEQPCPAGCGRRAAHEVIHWGTW